MLDWPGFSQYLLLLTSLNHWRDFLPQTVSPLSCVEVGALVRRPSCLSACVWCWLPLPHFTCQDFSLTSFYPASVGPYQAQDPSQSKGRDRIGRHMFRNNPFLETHTIPRTNCLGTTPAGVHKSTSFRGTHETCNLGSSWCTVSPQLTPSSHQGLCPGLFLST